MPCIYRYGAELRGVVGKLSSLLGRQPELPEWAYDGAILGIQGGTQTVYDKLEKVTEYDTAVAGVWCQDWEGRRVTAFGKQLQWNWEWDSERYPELDKKSGSSRGAACASSDI